MRLLNKLFMGLLAGLLLLCSSVSAQVTIKQLQRQQESAVTSTPHVPSVLTQIYLYDTTSNAITVNLPAIVTANRGVIWTFKLDTRPGTNNVTLDPSGAETVDGAATLVLTVLDRTVILRAPSTGTDWKQIGGGPTMGAFIPLADPDIIGDWIASTQTTYTDVNVSDDGVPAGATAVLVQHLNNACNVFHSVGVRKNGSVANGNQNFVATTPTPAGANGWEGEFIVPLDSSGIFEAYNNASATCTVFSAAVVGYFQN